MASSEFLDGQDPDEHAGEGLLPKEFKEGRPLLMGEVSLMLGQRAKEHEAVYDDGMGLSEMFQKSKEYCDRFSKLKNELVINHVLMLLQKKNDILTPFELAMLANLCPLTAEEAKAFLPSLEGKIDDDELLELLDDIQTATKYQSD